jgi:hypothetical protein
MWSIIVACALSCCGEEIDAAVPAPPEPVVAELTERLQTGSLIFSRGDCLAVKIFSQSSYTHVGGVVVRNGEVLVYDSMNGTGVRKTPFAEYLRQQTPSSVRIVHPKTPFSPEKAAAFEEHLESQLGRKYAVRHHLTGQRCQGLHCSEYMTDALMAAEMITAKNPPRVSPGSLLDGVMADNVYVAGNDLELKAPEQVAPSNLTWCQSAWYNTASCCSKSSTQLRRWILCR